MPYTKNQIGAHGEKLAVDFIQAKKYNIIDRNYRCRIGEIDIIAATDEYLVFIEVKSRISTDYSLDPLLSITKRKQQKLRSLAIYYIAKNNLIKKQIRCDVITVSLSPTLDSHNIEHLVNAF